MVTATAIYIDRYKSRCRYDRILCSSWNKEKRMAPIKQLAQILPEQRNLIYNSLRIGLALHGSRNLDHASKYVRSDGNYVDLRPRINLQHVAGVSLAGSTGLEQLANECQLHGQRIAAGNFRHGSGVDT